MLCGHKSEHLLGRARGGCLSLMTRGFSVGVLPPPPRNSRDFEFGTVTFGLSEPCLSIPKMGPTEPVGQGSCEIKADRDKMPRLRPAPDFRSVVLSRGLLLNRAIPGNISMTWQAPPRTPQFQTDRASKEPLGQGLVLFSNDILKDEGLPSLVPGALDPPSQPSLIYSTGTSYGSVF